MRYEPDCPLLTGLVYLYPVTVAYIGWIIMNQQNNIKRNFLQSLRNTTVLLLDIALIESLKTINSDQKQIKKLLRKIHGSGNYVDGRCSVSVLRSEECS